MFLYLLRSLSDIGTCLCFTWLSHLWSHFVGSSTGQGVASLESLPDDVMTDVLSRLPADLVVNMGRVCKRWCSLTATDYFVQLHFERSTPVMIFQTCWCDNYKITLFAVDWSSGQLIREIRSPIIESLQSKGSLQFSGSCNGLFIFREMGMSPLTYYIFNPIKREQITIAPPLIVGFFFNSLTSKYQLVTYCDTADGFEFYIGNLGPIITWREVGSFPYRPREPFAPSVVDGCLHWMAMGQRGTEDMLPPCALSIMIFSIEDCQFRFLPHPGKMNGSCQGHQKMHLLVTKGYLYAYGMYANTLDIWVLEDFANWYWIKKFSIYFGRKLAQYIIVDDYLMTSYQIFFEMKLIDIQKDEVLVASPEEGFLRCHMRLKTITEAQFAHLPNEGCSYTREICELTTIESTMSLMLNRDFFDPFQVVK